MFTRPLSRPFTASQTSFGAYGGDAQLGPSGEHVHTPSRSKPSGCGFVSPNSIARTATKKSSVPPSFALAGGPGHLSWVHGGAPSPDPASFTPPLRPSRSTATEHAAGTTAMDAAAMPPTRARERPRALR